MSVLGSLAARGGVCYPPVEKEINLYTALVDSSIIGRPGVFVLSQSRMCFCHCYLGFVKYVISKTCRLTSSNAFGFNDRSRLERLTIPEVYAS